LTTTSESVIVSYHFHVGVEAAESFDRVQHEVVVAGRLPGGQHHGEFLLAAEEKDEAVVLVLGGRRVSLFFQKFGKLFQTLLLPLGSHTTDTDLTKTKWI
jgi:hypothetical protein